MYGFMFRLAAILNDDLVESKMGLFIPPIKVFVGVEVKSCAGCVIVLEQLHCS